MPIFSSRIGLAAAAEADDDTPKARVDMLVHSCKDVPTTLPDGCTIGAILEREDPVDSLVVKQSLRDKYKSLDDLPSGSVVGTSSIRRVAQLRRLYPGLVFNDVVRYFSMMKGKQHNLIFFLSKRGNL